MPEELKVRKIECGVVLDKLPPFTSITALKILGLPYNRPENSSEYVIIPLMNVESKSMGRKDILKIEGSRDLFSLVEKKSGALALISEEIMINIIEDWKVVQKYHPNVPNHIIGLVNCPHYNCITNKSKEGNDNYSTKFEVIQRMPLEIECIYCHTRLKRREILENLIV
ncbi:MAG: aspartate carbamoyltransferase regulatory subunit [Nanoarchaeota archaeon]|nr:aspartate carbamoyltransferase regulatory subunit [Nanoarchaeota archaeon]